MTNANSDVVLELFQCAWRNRRRVLVFAAVSAVLVIGVVDSLLRVGPRQVVFELRRQAVRQMEDRYAQLQLEYEGDLRMSQYDAVVDLLPEGLSQKLTQESLASRYESLCRFRDLKCALPARIVLGSDEPFPAKFVQVYDGKLGGPAIGSEQLYLRCPCVMGKKVSVIRMSAVVIWLVLNLAYVAVLRKRQD